MNADDPRRRKLPAGWNDLASLAMDLRWTHSRFAQSFWERIDPEAWERTNNPYEILLNAHKDRLDELARSKRCQRELKAWRERRDRYDRDKTWFSTKPKGSARLRVAYFSLEFGLSEALPIYSGGLGILAGDHLKSASDLGVPLVGVGLLYQQGYFRQVLSPDGDQIEALPYNDPSSMPVSPAGGLDGRWPRVRLELPGRTLYVRVWQARVGRVPLYLLDTNDPLNSPWDRGITANLYAAGREKRLLQEIVLGVGGWRLLEQLDLGVQVCHLNEGHAAFVVLERAASFARRHRVSFDVALRATRAGNIFTTHTSVEAAFDKFEPSLLHLYARPVLESQGVPPDRALAMGRRDPQDENEPFNMAYLAIRGSCRVNGVARLHGRVSRKLFQPLFPGHPVGEVPVGSVTNGVHLPTWDSLASDDLWTKASPKVHWHQDPTRAVRGIEALPSVELWRFRGQARGTLVEYVRRRLERQLREAGCGAEAVERARHVLDPNVLTLAFARRFTGYKRPTLLLHDEERLVRILSNAECPVQLILAGKAHPHDGVGKQMVQRMARFAARPDIAGRVVFLQDYDMLLGQRLTGGVDVWVNLPRRPAEACGTSGMKVTFNGGLHCSVPDGWWDAAYDPAAGWKVGDRSEGGDEASRDAADAQSLYELLENEIVPEFYTRDDDGLPAAWVERVRRSMVLYTPRFSADRMVREYVETAYLPAAKAYRERARGGGKLARKIERWIADLSKRWQGMRLVALDVSREGDAWSFDAIFYLGELDPDAVRVELFAEPRSEEERPFVAAMERDSEVAGAVNGYRYQAKVPADRPAEHYTPRVVPHRDDVFVPMEAGQILWASGAVERARAQALT